MAGVVLIGDAARSLADAFAELGLDVVESTADADRVYAVGIGRDAQAALLIDDATGVVGIDCSPPIAAAGAGELRAPVLAVFPEQDQRDAYAFAEALNAHGVANETVVYDGVEPGFFGTHREATADAWRLIRRFMGVPAPE